MATLGLFSPELLPKAWFDAELYPLAWFDPTLVGAAAAISFSDASVPVQVLVGAETASFILVNDASVPVNVFVGVESTTFVLFDDVSVPIHVFVGTESFEALFEDADVVVEATSPAETVELVALDVSVPVNTEAPSEEVQLNALDIAIQVVAAVFAETFVAPTTSVDDVSVAVQAIAPSESVVVVPNPQPQPQPARDPRGGGVPLEDYLVGDYTVGELRKIQQSIDGASLIEEIVELPVRQETREERRSREAGEPRFSGLLKEIIEKQPEGKEAAPKKSSGPGPALLFGAVLLGMWIAAARQNSALEDDEDELGLGEDEDELDLEESALNFEIEDLEEPPTPKKRKSRAKKAV